MSRMSRNPAVTSMPVFAPRRSMTALVTRVVPCAIVSTSAMGTSSRRRRAAVPSITTIEGSAGVVRRLSTAISLPLSSNSAKSVNVPPMSMPSRQVKVFASEN